MAPNVYVQLNAAVDQALPYEGMTAEVEYVKCRDHLPRRRKESVVTAAQPKRRVTPQPSQATSKGANPEARKQWREAIAQAIVGLIINLDAVKVRNMYIYIYTYAKGSQEPRNVDRKSAENIFCQLSVYFWCVAFERLLDFLIGTGECGAGSTYIIYIDLYMHRKLKTGRIWLHIAVCTA